MMSISRSIPAAAAFTLLAVSCGGSSDDASTDTEVTDATVEQVEEEVEATDAVEEQAAPDTDAAPDTPAPDTAAPETAAPATESPDTAVEDEVAESEPAVEGDGEPIAEAAAGEGVSASLVEWAIEAPAEYAAGEITFTATNNGNFPHEFAVIAGEGYESLPLAEGGAVIEDDLPTGALIGRTGRLGGGSSEDLTVTLAPGNYVLVCNLGGGNNSHAGQGQRLDITVS